MTGQMNENGVSTAGKRTQAQFRQFLVERGVYKRQSRTDQAAFWHDDLAADGTAARK